MFYKTSKKQIKQIWQNIKLFCQNNRYIRINYNSLYDLYMLFLKINLKRKQNEKS